jgi:hypothetical protein
MKGGTGFEVRADLVCRRPELRNPQIPVEGDEEREELAKEVRRKR